MKNDSKLNIKRTTGEEYLSELIKQAGHDAREKKNRAMIEHFSKLRAVIIEADCRRREHR